MQSRLILYVYAIKIPKSVDYEALDLWLESFNLSQVKGLLNVTPECDELHIEVDSPRALAQFIEIFVSWFNISAKEQADAGSSN